MPNKGDKRRATVDGVPGVEQVYMQNSYYTTVDGRIRIANHADPTAIVAAGAGYTVREYRVVEMGNDRWAYMCLVEYPVGSGHTFPGSDFIDMRDASGLAKAETSAIGRALGLAGIAIDEGIASANEMQRHLTSASANGEAPTNGARAADAATAAAAPVPHQAAPLSPRERMRRMGWQDDKAYLAKIAEVIGHPSPYSGSEQAKWIQYVAEQERLAAERAATPLAQLTGGARPN